MRKKIFVGICLIQLIIVLSIFMKYEYVKKTGTKYKLEVTVYDPYDMFRGNYVRLTLTQNSIGTSSDGSLKNRNKNKYDRGSNKVYLVLEDKKDGKTPSKIIDITREKPEKDYIKGYIWNSYSRKKGYYFRSDLKRYYGTPENSLQAEKDLRERKKAYINIYVSGDTVIIDSLEVAGKIY